MSLLNEVKKLLNESFTRIDFENKYFNPTEMVDGRIYVVSNKLPFGSFKKKIATTWIEREGHELEYDFGDHFTDVYPFVKNYKMVYDLYQQIIDKFGNKSNEI